MIQLISLSTRNFSIFSITFLISSLLRILNEDRTFMPLTYSLKGRVWQGWVTSLRQQHSEQSHEQQRIRVLQRKNSAKAIKEMTRQNGKYSSTSNWYIRPWKQGNLIGSWSGQILLLAASIHSPTTGLNITRNGSRPRVRDMKSYPSPQMREELACRSERLVMYLLRRLIKASGMRAGTPAPKRVDITTMRQTLADSLQTSSLYDVIYSFMCFCKMRPSSSSREALLEVHLSSRKKTHVTAVLTMMKLTQITETFLYHTLLKLGQKERLLIAKKFLMSVETMVIKETQLLGWKPKMLAQMSRGTKMELKMMKMVQMVVFVSRPADFEAGRTKLTSLSTIKPKMKLVTPEVKITAYWMPWEICISVRQGEQMVLMRSSLKELMRFTSQQHLRATVSRVAWAQRKVLGTITSSQLLAWEEMQMEQRPMIAQLIPRKMRMTQKEQSPLKKRLQKLSQKVPQLMSSGEGTRSFLMRRGLPLKRYFCYGVLMQQQQQALMQEWEQLSKRQWLLKYVRQSTFDFQY